jgi:hypothetical protein
VNNNVHDMNKKGPHCSCGEQQCSRGERGQSRESASEEGRGAQNRGGRNNRKGIPTGRIPEKEEESAAPPPQHHEKKDAVSGNKSQVAENTSVDYEQSDLFQQASPGVQAIITEWRAYQGPMPVTAELLAQAEELAAYQPEPGEIQACADWKYANDKKGWHAQHGMTLGHVAKDMPRFRSIKKRAQAASSPRAQQGNEASELAAAKERAKANNQQTLDRVRKMLAAKQQVAQGGNQQHAEAQYH